jgi:hypothetical protein
MTALICINSGQAPDGHPSLLVEGGDYISRASYYHRGEQFYFIEGLGVDNAYHESLFLPLSSNIIQIQTNNHATSIH